MTPFRFKRGEIWKIRCPNGKETYVRIYRKLMPQYPVWLGRSLINKDVIIFMLGDGTASVPSKKLKCEVLYQVKMIGDINSKPIGYGEVIKLVKGKIKVLKKISPCEQ